MKVEVNEKFPVEIESEGTIMDFVDGEFVFVIKDQEWTDFEKAALRRNELEIDLVVKYDISMFLITVLDAIDTSDFIFNIHEHEEPSLIFEKECMSCSLYLIDGNNVVAGVKHVTLSKEGTTVLQTQLKKILEAPYQEAEFDCNLDGIQNTWEPFELQEFAVMKEVFH